MELEELVVKHSGWIRKKARYYYSDETDADDLASETIYKCLCQKDRFDTRRSFKPWAQTIMENTFKVQYNRRKCVLFTGYDEIGTALSDLRSDQRAIVARMYSIIRDCMRRSCCIECVLLYAKGYDYSEIAAKVGIPIGTVRSRIYTGRKFLQKALK